MKNEAIRVDKAKLRKSIQDRIDASKGDYDKALKRWEEGFPEVRANMISQLTVALAAYKKAKTYEDLRSIHIYQPSTPSKPDKYSYSTSNMEAAIRKLDLLSDDTIPLDNREFATFMQWV